MKIEVKKRYRFYGLCLLMIAFFCSCSENEIQKSSASVQFRIAAEAIAAGRVSTDRLPSAIKVSIKPSDDTEIVYAHILKLININGEYLSEPVQLKVGNYQLIEFIVVDDSSNAIYAAPLEGSEFADFVENPLPIPFSAVDDIAGVINPEVIVVLPEHTSDRFGYSAFQFSPIQVFKLNVSVTNAGAPVSSTVAITGLSDSGQSLWTSSNTLGPGTQELWVRNSSRYVFNIASNGYPAQTIAFDTLRSGQHITVDLSKSDAMVNLTLKVKKVSSIPFPNIDSAAIHYYNSQGRDIYHPLSLSGQYAMGNISVPAGSGYFRVIFFTTETSNKISRQLVGSFHLHVTPEMKSIHSGEGCIAINGSTAQDCTIAIGWDFFNAHYFGSDKLSIVLPKSDGTSPYFEVWNRTGSAIAYVSIDRKVYPVDDPHADLRVAYAFWECQSDSFKNGHLFEMHALKDLAFQLPNRELDSATSKVNILFADGRELYANFLWDMNQGVSEPGFAWGEGQ